MNFAAGRRRRTTSRTRSRRCCSRPSSPVTSRPIANRSGRLISRDFRRRLTRSRRVRTINFYPVSPGPDFSVSVFCLPSPALDSSSSALIAPYLVPFRCKPTSSPSNFDLLSPHLLRTLRQIPSAGDDQPAATLQTACPDRLKDVKPWFVKGLRKALWETSSLAKLRVRYTLASYLSVSSALCLWSFRGFLH